MNALYTSRTTVHTMHVLLLHCEFPGHQLYIMKNHRPTVHVFLLHCEPQSHQLYCAMEVVQQGVIQIFTLQWCCSLKFSCCPGPRDFTFTVILRGIHDCTVLQGMHWRVNPKFLFIPISFNKYSTNSLPDWCAQLQSM